MKRRGQVTIFVIIAIVLVGTLTLYFSLKQQLAPETTGYQNENNPRAYLTTCLNDKINEAIDKLSTQGGDINPRLAKEFKFIDDQDYYNISYLCYTENYYISCDTQRPLFLNHIKEEIYEYIEDEVRTCYDQMAASIESKGYVVDTRYRGFDLTLYPTKIEIALENSLTLTKNEQTSNENNFKIYFQSRIYELASVAQEIASQEARFCNFEYIGYMLIYPKFEIQKKISMESKIYKIINKKTGEFLNIAIRSCAPFPSI